MEAQTPSEGTLSSSLGQHAAVFEDARKKRRTLPTGNGQALFAPTFAEAQARVAAREEERRRAAARRDKSKQRSSKSKVTPVGEAQLPGAVPGAEGNNTAFWIFTEGYLRDITAGDLELLTPRHDEPLNDPIFRLSAPGPPFRPAAEQRAQPRQPASASAQRPRQQEKPRQEAADNVQPTPMSPAGSQGGLANGTEQLADNDKQRKSRRLHAKALIRDVQSRKPAAAEAQSPVSAEPKKLPRVPQPAVEDVQTSELVEAAPILDEAPGAKPSYLLEAADEQLAALLTSQIKKLAAFDVSEMADACGLDEVTIRGWLGRNSSDELQDDPAEATSLPTEARPLLRAWLVGKAAELSGRSELAEGQKGQGSDHPSKGRSLQVDQFLGQEALDSLPDSWTAWWQLLKPEVQPAQLEARPSRPEALHPHTQLLLSQPASASYLHADALGPSRNGGTMTPSALSPMSSGELSRPVHDASLEATSGLPRLLPGTPATPIQPLKGDTATASGPPMSGISSTPRGLEAAGLAALVAPPPTPLTPTVGPFAPTPARQLVDRLQSHAEAGPRHDTGTFVGSSKPGLAARRKAAGLSDGLLGRAAYKRASSPAVDPSRNALAAAVATCISKGEREGDIDAQWRQLAESSEQLAAAPDDEVSAEMLAVQYELLQQMAVNRRHAAGLLTSVLQDLVRQEQAAAEQAKGVEIATAWVAKQRAVKKTVKREKREAAMREAQKATEAYLQGSPRKVAGRVRGSAAEPSTPNSGVSMPEAVMYDLLAERGAEDDALCAVCGGGDSSRDDGNEIVFCERCDVAVHQRCYGVNVIPAGEWLCWPCKRFEEAELASGKPQSEIRPPRWEQGAGKAGSPVKALSGGGRSVECLLCPVSRGAFRQTLDGKHWVHQVCAIWHPEPSVRHNSACAAIDGCGNIKPDRWEAECVVCRRTQGAAMRCSTPNCGTSFHPLCARNAGCHLFVAENTAGAAVDARAYCALHSSAQREKDLGLASSPEGPASLLRKEARIRQHLSRAGAVASEAYERMVEERRVLTRVRLELESLRILLQRINRREKFKRDELRVAYELVHMRLQNPAWVPAPGTLVPEDAEPTLRRGAGRGRGLRLEPLPRAGSLQVDREVMMTTNEAAATNDRLPRGFMYVPFESLKG